MRHATFALFATIGAFPAVAVAQQHEHSTAAHDHAGKPVECLTLAAPPWSGLPASDLAVIRQLQTSLTGVQASAAAAQSGFAPAFGDIPTMGVHWVNRARMQDGVKLDQPDHLLFTRIAGHDSLVGVAYAFRGPLDAKIPATFSSELAQWHDHANLGGGAGQTLHMLHVWFVPSPYGPFAGNNFFLPLMSAGMALPSPCWIQTDAEVERLELVASLIDVVNRDRDSLITTTGQGRRAMRRDGRAMSLLSGLADRVGPSFRALDSAALRGDRIAWQRAADQSLGLLRPLERQLLTTVRDLVKGVQVSTGRAPQQE